MTEVLSITSRPDGASYFGGSTSLRRSPSQNSFLLQNPVSYSRPSHNLTSGFTNTGHETRFPTSVPSSAPSSPRFAQREYSNQTSCPSTPSSMLSLEEECNRAEEKEEEEDILFPSYDNGGVFSDTQELHHDLEPHSSPELVRADTITRSASDESLPIPSSPASASSQATAGDDNSLKQEPTMRVDYFSHNWKEEDIWSSWRYIVTKRKALSNSIRLENASWRTWSKSLAQLETISPITLDWSKDLDVTWLYGPLQSGTIKPLSIYPTPPASQLSRTNSFGSKKPILKKRSASELMLQQCLSSSTLMKQATDALRAQHPNVLCQRPGVGARALSDFVPQSKRSSFNLKLGAGYLTDMTSTSTSGGQTPCTKRHIHFNNRVEQCIAINKGSDDHEDYYSAIQDDSSSDDDLLTMKPVQSRLSNQHTPRNSFSSESKIIAMLPSTTLKYRGDTPEPPESTPKQKGSFWNAASQLSSSLSSQETLKMKTPPINFLLDEEDDDADMDWQPSGARRNSLHLYPSISSSYDLNTEHSGELHRTPSGMFMPDGDDDNMPSTGILGKVVDTVNTAKDIAHVIWNVGWRQ